MHAANYAQLCSVSIVSLWSRPLLAPSIARKNDCLITIYHIQPPLPPGRPMRKRTNDILQWQNLNTLAFLLTTHMYEPREMDSHASGNLQFCTSRVFLFCTGYTIAESLKSTDFPVSGTALILDSVVKRLTIQCLFPYHSVHRFQEVRKHSEFEILFVRMSATLSLKVFKRL